MLRKLKSDAKTAVNSRLASDYDTQNLYPHPDPELDS